MSLLTDILEFNDQFIEEKGYEPYITGRYPNKKVSGITSTVGFEALVM